MNDSSRVFLRHPLLNSFILLLTFAQGVASPLVWKEDEKEDEQKKETSATMDPGSDCSDGRNCRYSVASMPEFHGTLELPETRSNFSF